MVTDHKYVQECIDALKGRVRELEKWAPGPAISDWRPKCLPTCSIEATKGCDPRCPVTYPPITFKITSTTTGPDGITSSRIAIV
jgi:hypothetical protein